MSLNLTVRSKRVRRDAGIALITTILLLVLMSSLLVGFTVLLYTDIQLSGASNDQVRAFYGAEAGMEQMTANLGNLFSQNYSPSIGQINAISSTPPVLQGIQYLKGDGSSGYSIKPQAYDANGNPAPTISTIKSGAYQGMTPWLPSTPCW
jgi:Tfp pilus assembly protein PilX